MKTSTSSFLFAAIATAFAAPAFAADNADFARGRLLVEPRAGLTAAEFDKILKVHGGKRRKLGQSNIHVVELPAGASEEAVAKLLSKRPELKFAELDRVVKVTGTANDAYMGSEWHLSKIGATTAWDTTQGSGVVVAVLDSGVDASHPDLAGQLVAGYNIYSNNTDTADVCGHGTGVAGTIAASTNNSTGVAAVAGSAKVMPIRIAYVDATTGGCMAYLSTIANGITYAADHGAKIANISYDGLAGSSAVLSAAAYMKSKGGLVFAAAGNDGTSRTFAPTTNMIIVSATDSADAKASWSSYGPFVSVAAPGAGIWSTVKGGTYKAWNGTSFATPVTAGVAALMMAANPSLSNTTIESLLFSTAVDLGTAGRDDQYGYGRINAAAAVAAAASAMPPADTTAPTVAIAAPLGSSTVSGNVTVSVNAADNVGVARVDLKVNGTVVASASTGPFSFSWDSTGVANGMNNLVAVAYDAAGNVASSTPVSVNVANGVTPPVADTVAPVVALVNPTSGAVSGTVNVTANASDNNGAAGIALTIYVDGVKKASGTGSSLAFSWNTRKEAAGNHTVQAVAKDAAGNTSTTTVTVTK